MVCPEVTISRRIYLWEGKSASTWPCESSNASPDCCGQEPWILVVLWGRADVVTAGIFLGHVCPAVDGLAEAREGQVWVGADVLTAREETGCCLWVVQQSKVFGCCPGVQALTVRGCCNPSWRAGNWSRQRTGWGVGTSGWLLEWVASVDVCRRWRSCILQCLCTTTQSVIVLETDRPMTVPNARGQTCQGCDSCLRLTQPVRSWESLAYLQLCSGSPAGWWWKPCSYRLAAQWQRSCLQ